MFAAELITVFVFTQLFSKAKWKKLHISVVGSERRHFCATECGKTAVQGHPGSLILASMESVCDFLLVINGSLGPILDRFWDTVTYWPKTPIFPTTVSFNALARGEPFRISGWTLQCQDCVLELSAGEDFLILICVVLTQCQRVTDGQTDTNRHADVDQYRALHSKLCWLSARAKSHKIPKTTNWN